MQIRGRGHPGPRPSPPRALTRTRGAAGVQEPPRAAPAAAAAADPGAASRPERSLSAPRRVSGCAARSERLPGQGSPAPLCGRAGASVRGRFCSRTYFAHKDRAPIGGGGRRAGRRGVMRASPALEGL